MEEVDINPSDIENTLSFSRTPSTPNAPVKPNGAVEDPNTPNKDIEAVDIPKEDIESVDIPDEDIETDESTKEDDTSFFTPRANLHQTYINEKASEESRLKNEYETNKAADDAYNSELTKQRYAHRKERARKDEGELEKTNSLSGFFTNSDYTVDSISRKWNRLAAQGNNDVDIKKTLSSLGVSDSDLRKTIRYRSGDTGETDTLMDDAVAMANLAKDAGKEVGKWGGEFINGLGASLNGLADTLSEYHPLNMVNNMAHGRMPLDRSAALQDFFDKTRAQHDAATAEYKRQRGGAGSFLDFAGRYGPDIATSMYNPTSLAKAAIVGGALAMPSAKTEGYDTTQAIALSGLTMASLGALAGVAKYAPKMLNKTVKEMDSETKQVWNSVKSKTGLSDSELQEMLKAYSKEFKVEGVDSDTIASNFLMHVIANKHLAKEGYKGKLGSIYDNTVLSNPQTVKRVKDAFTSRAKELDKVHAKSPLGKLIKKNRKGTEDDGIAVNWRQLHEDILNQERNVEGKFDLKSPLIKRIAKYADMYDSNDLAMQKVLKDIRHTNKTPREEMEEIAVGAIKTKLTVTLSRLLGTNALPSMSPVARIINFVAKKLPSGRDTYNVQNFIVNQLEKGTPLNAKVLADDLRKFQSIASMSDKEVDDIVEDLVTVSQQTDISARRAKLKSQLDELKKSTKEHKLAMAEADNKVKFAKVAVDDSIEAGEGVREAKRALEQAKRDQRVVQAKSGKEINLNEELSQKLSNSELPSVPKQGMNTILKKIDPTNHGKVIVPEKPSDLLKPVEVVQPKPQTVKPKVEEPKVDKPLEMVKPKPEVAKMGQEDIEKLRDAQRGLREKNGHKIFGKNLMEEFHSGDKKKVFSEFLAQKLRDGEVSKEDIMKYYHANASLGTITELTDGAISGVTGTAKRLLKSLKDSGIELDDFKQYMKDLSYTEHKSTIQDYSRNSHGLATSKKMKDFLNSAPTNYHNSPVHRGTRMTEEELAGIKEGEVISNDNVLSTSKSAREAMKFKRGKVVGKKPVAIFIKNANGHDISSVSVDPSEAEVVLNSGKAFKVIKKVDDSTVLLTLQEIPVDKTVRARKVRL